MLYSLTELNRYAGVAGHGGPTLLQTWVNNAIARIWPRAARKPAPPASRDLVREAAEVRAWADTVRRTDPRFAEDLFAAADRHEVGAG